MVLLCLFAAGCVYDWPTSRIIPDGQPGCGNGLIEPPEDCDSEDLVGETCASLGYEGGTLACANNCAFDTSGCTSNAECGDGIVAPDEECDDGNLTEGDGCSAQCGVESGWGCQGEPSICTTGCGNGVCHLDSGEDSATCPEDCGWVQLAGGKSHTCGLKADGTAWCWGLNDHGQLGNDSLTSSPTPIRVPDLAGVVAIGAGERHSCAITDAGFGYCWGDNEEGQLGDGTVTPSLVPVPVAGLGDAATLSVGKKFNCATTTGQQALCWGKNREGQLGTGDNTNRQTATAVEEGDGLTSAKAVAAGDKQGCAVRADDTVWCWGHNREGQLGTGDTTDSPLPRAVDTAGGFAGATRISAGDKHICAQDLDGVAWCWGDGADRRLGFGSVQDQPSPALVLDVGTISAISAGEKHSCAVDTDGLGWCWGAGGDGQLGSNDTPISIDAVAVVNLTGMHDVTAGAKHTCAILSDGTAWCWGANDAGQLGDGNSQSSSVPVLVDDPY